VTWSTQVCFQICASSEALAEAAPGCMLAKDFVECWLRQHCAAVLLNLTSPGYIPPLCTISHVFAENFGLDS
jgi:hypothetical protein